MNGNEVELLHSTKQLSFAANLRESALVLFSVSPHYLSGEAHDGSLGMVANERKGREVP